MRALRGLAIGVLCAAVLAASPLAAAGDPIKRHTPADLAKARTVVLKRSDVGPGWKRDTSPDTDDDVSCSYYDPDESDLVQTGSAEGNFAAQLAFVGSEVSIYRTVAQAQSAWNRVVKPAYARCLGDELRRDPPQAGSSVRIVRAGVTPFPRLAPKTAAWRIVVRVTDAGTVIPLTLDLVALGRGRILAAVGFIQVGGAPPAAEERRLAGLVARRMG